MVVMRQKTVFERIFSALCAAVVAVCAFAFCPSQAADKDKSRPLLVMIFDQNCKAWCSQVRPMVAELRKGYGEEVEFAEIDVTHEVLKDAKEKAKELGIGGKLGDTIGYVPLVLICSADRKDVKEFVGPKKKEAYEDQLKKLLAKRG
jgi:hypothetical protein